MSVIRINELLKKRGMPEVRIINQACEGARIKVLVGTCKHCMKLKANTELAMRELGYPLSEMETISDLVRIAKLGVITTPALIVEGKLVSCGKVLSVEEIKCFITKKE